MERISAMFGKLGKKFKTLSGDDTGISWYGAVFLVVNAALGAGLLNFPKAFNETGGIVVGLIAQGVMMFFIVPALMILVYCSDHNMARTLQDVMLGACGKRGQQLASLAVGLYCFGTCITFLIIIGDQYDRVFASLYGSHFCHTWYLNRNFTMVVSSIVIVLPFCYPKRIDFLQYCSSVGVVAILYIPALIVGSYYMDEHHHGPGPYVPPAGDDWTKYFMVVPVICFGYQCHVSAIPIYSCLRDRHPKQFIKSAIVAIIICIVTYNLAAVYGAMTFGNNVPADILQGYDANKPYVLIGIIAIALKTYTTYPILLFCGREALGSLIIDVLSQDESSSARYERARRFSIATIWFGMSLVLAVLIPNIGGIIKILGSLAAVFIFIFPGLCMLQHIITKDPCLYLIRDRLIVTASVIFMTIGSFLFGVVTYEGVQAIANGSSESSLCD